MQEVVTKARSIEKLEKAAFILKTLSHPLRLSMVDILSQQDKMSVNEICQALDSEQSLTSHHLSNMKLKGILSSSREGKNIYYSLKMKEVVKILACMDNCDAISV
jgi:DNA-binding transcriptional ArsR family regulator